MYLLYLLRGQIDVITIIVIVTVLLCRPLRDSKKIDCLYITNDLEFCQIIHRNPVLAVTRCGLIDTVDK